MYVCMYVTRYRCPPT